MSMPALACARASRKGITGRVRVDSRSRERAFPQDVCRPTRWRPRRQNAVTHDKGLDPSEDTRWERECIGRAQSGDRDAFGALAERYANRIYAHLYRLVRNQQEAEDLAQEALIRAYRHLDGFDNTRPFRSWLYTIATNLGLNALRSRRRRGPGISLDRQDKNCLPVSERIASGQDVCHEAQRGELREQLAEAISELPERAALLVQMHYSEGMSIREAANVLGISEGAGKVALCRARKQLRELLIEGDAS